MKLKMLPRLYRPGDGDCGICFEYAVHDALMRGDSMVVDRVDDVLSTHCRIIGQEIGSILFAVEKAGVNRLIDTAATMLTSESLLMYGSRGRPVRLRRHLADVAEALSREGASDAPFKDEQRNLIVCPLKHDGDFMEVFYNGWQVVQQFIAADARVPREVALPRPPQRQVARYLAERREYPVRDVIEALAPLSQPELLDTRERDAGLVVTRRGAEPEVSTVLAPLPRTN